MSPRSRALVARIMLSVDAATMPGGRFTRELGRIIADPMLTSQERVTLQVQQGLAEGLWFDLNPRTDRHYYNGITEQPVQEVLGRMIQAGMVVYDVGANVGFFSLLMHRFVGESGRVFAFEADPEMVGELSKNVSRNDCQNVTTVQAAVWSSTGSVRFLRADPLQSPSRGTGSVSVSGTGDSMMVKSISLDDFALGAPPPDLIKCDAEGGEVEVFRGALRLLEKHRPVVLCEIHSTGQSSELRKIFMSAHYALESVDQNHWLATPNAKPERRLQRS